MVPPKSAIVQFIAIVMTYGWETKRIPIPSFKMPLCPPSDRESSNVVAVCQVKHNLRLASGFQYSANYKLSELDLNGFPLIVGIALFRN